MIPHVNLTLNLLRNSRVNPNLSAHAYLHGTFDFNKTPLCPAGTKVIIHSKPDNRKSWSYHGKEGWTIGSSPEHYRCIKCFLPDTRAEINADTVVLLPQKIQIPSLSPDQQLQKLAIDLITLLKNRSTIPGLSLSRTTHNGLHQLGQLFIHNYEQKINDQQTQHQQQSIIPPPRTTILNKPTCPNPFVTSTQKIHDHQQPITHSKQFATNNIYPQSFNPTEGVKNYVTDYYNKMSEGAYAGSRRTIGQARFVPQPRDFRHLTTPAYYQIQSIQYTCEQAATINYKGTKLSIDKLLNGPTHEIWSRSLGNELGRIAQGIKNRIKGNDTVEYIRKSEVPKYKKVTYANFVCDIRHLKQETHRVRLTVGGDKLEYLFDTTSPAASLLETKLLINSVISDAHKGAFFITIDLKDFFLQTIMDEPEYMRIHERYFPKDIRQQYNIDNIVGDDGYVYCKIKRGMYGLKQAARLAFDQLVKKLQPFGYYPDPNHPTIWHHKTRKTKFCLCVDDFAVKVFSKSDADHLINALKTNYDITTDWKGQNYCGLNLSWNYDEGYVDIAMNEYVRKALTKLQHTTPTKPQDAPHKWTTPAYGRKTTQLAPSDDSSPNLSAKETTRIQSIVGMFLYYARAVDLTILTALNDIGINQSKPTETTKEKAHMLLDYLATHPDAKTTIQTFKYAINDRHGRRILSSTWCKE